MTAEAAYEHCRQIARASRSSFYAGMRLLAPDRRAALFAVYALARRIDDVADGDLTDDDKLAALAQLRSELAHIDDSEEPVLVAVADAAHRFPIPLDAFADLVDGAELDVRGTEYETFVELERYCRCVAGSIGRLALGVFDCSDRERGALLADDLGVALQIGNILRDLGEDLAGRRVYLPHEDLERFGVSRQLEGPVELVVAFEAQRGLEWLDRGLELVPLLDRRSTAAVLAMAGKYRVLLERIADEPALVLKGRVSLRRWEKGLVLARSLAGVGA